MDVFWLEQTESEVPKDDAWLSARESECLARMRFPKRRRDWRLGRWTAKLAVAGCLGRSENVPRLAEIEILAAASGAPEVFWNRRPARVSISLTHREGRAACAVTASGTPLGCDLELVESRSTAFLTDYFSAEELALLGQTAAVDELATILWSAKESALKALRTGLRMSTLDVIVTKLGDPMQPGMPNGDAVHPHSTDNWRPLQVECRDGSTFYGFWNSSSTLVRTLVSTEPVRKPILLPVPDHKNGSDRGNGPLTPEPGSEFGSVPAYRRSL
jgi:4'-phosphopantetheinyl transferase